MFHVKQIDSPSSVKHDDLSEHDLAVLLVGGASQWGVALSEEQTRKCLAYLQLVLQAGESLNLSSVTSPRDAVLKHCVDSLACLRSGRMPTEGSIVDVGSGAGFPAVPLALALPEARLVALESRGKKADFIRRAADLCEIANVEVVVARCEDAGRGEFRDQFDAAVCRALAPPEISLELCLPLIRPGGILSVLCGEDDAGDAARLAFVADALGADDPKGTRYHLPYLGHARGMIEVRKILSTPAKFPRRAGMAKKRPLSLVVGRDGRTC